MTATGIFGDLIGRTVALLSIATALVALSVAFELPTLGGRVAIDDAHAGVHGASGGAMVHEVESEAAFLAGMVPHHQEAVSVALEVLSRGERPEVRALAAEVVATQAQEIDRLRAWLAAWYPDEPPAPYEPMMRALVGLPPQAVDIVFVFDMILHHEMAIAMAEGVLALDPAPRPEVAALARDVIRVQSEEIATLNGWVEAWWPGGAADHGDH
jgi:uncharacterized protein (DUF305 family)